MPLKSGDTFLLPKRSDQKEHLWVVVAELPGEPRRGICVSVTTQRPHSDITCILGRGDHPFVKHASVVYYQDARELDLTAIEKALAAKLQNVVCVQHAPCSTALLQRIRSGLLVSALTPKHIKAQCRNLFNIPG